MDNVGTDLTHKEHSQPPPKDNQLFIKTSSFLGGSWYNIIKQCVFFQVGPKNLNIWFPNLVQGDLD